MLGVQCSTTCSINMDVDSDGRRLDAFAMWIWRRVENISWRAKVTNEEVFWSVNEERQILNSVWQRKHRWFGHVLRHDRLLYKITEGRMSSKSMTRRIQMLHDLANDNSVCVHCNNWCNQ